MDNQEIINSVQKKLQTAVEHFVDELKKLRTGRAHASMLDGVNVDAYGSSMPINQVATISAPEAQLLQITPFDPSNLQAIAGAIRDNQSLGLNPVDDGHIVRIQIPQLTSERRAEIVKQLHEKMENSLIAMRSIRHDGLKSAEQLKKDKKISDDDYKRLEKQVDELMTKQKNEVEQLSKKKEAEILTI